MPSGLQSDVLVLGMGLGAAAIARRLHDAGATITMVPGVGRSRSTHLDGGVIDADLLRRAFGSIERAPLVPSGSGLVFRRDELERWAIDQLGDRVSVRADFEDGRIVPDAAGGHRLIDASGAREIRAGLVVLTEGANPKIGIAARLRKDFPPEELIHFGRAWLRDATATEASTGEWRTSWGMPAWYSVIPQQQGAIVSASARIENIMRTGRDGRDVLRDLLVNPLASRLGLTGDPGAIGMELVPLLPAGETTPIDAHTIVITPDANGLIDARSLRRFNNVLTGAHVMAEQIAIAWPAPVDWLDVSSTVRDVFSADRTPYHDDRETGFIEDGPGTKRGLLGRLRKR